MKIFNKNSLVLAIACLLAIASVGSAIDSWPCFDDVDCTMTPGRRLSTMEYECDCDVPFDDCPQRRLGESSNQREERKLCRRALREANKRGFESNPHQKRRRAKSCKAGGPFTCVPKSASIKSAKTAKTEKGDADSF